MGRWHGQVHRTRSACNETHSHHRLTRIMPAQTPADLSFSGKLGCIAGPRYGADSTLRLQSWTCYTRSAMRLV